MTVDLEDWERGIVAILLDNHIVGTGFVVAPNKVLTCAHVVTKDAGDMKGESIQILFFLKQVKSQSQSTDDQQQDQQAENPRTACLLKDYSSPPKQHDIAVLTFEGELPYGISPLRVDPIAPLRDTEVQTRGFPENILPYIGIGGKGQLVATTTHGTTGESHWTLRSQEITCGFSGAPLVRKSDKRVIGMARAIPGLDEDLRNKETAIALTIQTIIKVCPDLIDFSKEELDRRRREAVDKLIDKVKELLDANQPCIDKLSKELGIGDSVQPELLPSAIAEKLITGRMSLSDVVRVLVVCHRYFAEKNTTKSSKDALAALYAIYLAILSATIDPSTMEKLISQILVGELMLVVPSSSRTVVAIMMAGLDGAIARLDDSSPEKTWPKSRFEVEAPAERGIEGGAVREDLWEKQLAEALKVPLTELPMTPENRRARLNAILKSKTSLEERLFVVIHDQKSPAPYGLAEQLRGWFRELHLVKMEEPAPVIEELHSTALSWWIHTKTPKPKTPQPKKPKR